LPSQTEIVTFKRSVYHNNQQSNTNFNNRCSDKYQYQDTSIKPSLKRITKAKNYQTICGGVTITADYIIVPSCPYEANGSISIELDSIKGGRGPYLFSFDGEKFSTACTYENLSKGEYRLRIKDQNGCLSSLFTILVEDNKCDEFTHKSFAPSKGEVISIAFDNPKNGILKILNKEGEIVYSSSITNKKSIGWNGKKMDGTIAEPGLYIYLLKLETVQLVSGQINITP